MKRRALRPEGLTPARGRRSRAPAASPGETGLPDGGAGPVIWEQPRVAARGVQPRPVPAAGRRLSTLDRAVLDALCYADIFDWPLTPAEIHRYLPVPATTSSVAAALRSPGLRGRLERADGLVA